MQYGMPRTVQPSSRKIEFRTRTVHESEHILVELHGFFQLARRHIVVVEHANTHFHHASPRRKRFILVQLDARTSAAWLAPLMQVKENICDRRSVVIDA